MTDQPNDGAASAASEEEAIWAELTTEEAAPAAAEPEETPPVPEEPKAEAPEEKTDPWASVPPELHEQYQTAIREREDLTHRFKSEQGRSAALARKLAEAEKAKAAPEPPKAKPADKTDDEAELARIRQEYPEVTEPLIRVIEQIRAETKGLTERHQQQIERFYVREARNMEQQHPGFEAFIAQNVDTYLAWLQQQPDPLRKAAENNANRIEDAQEAALVVSEFKKFLAGQKAPQPQTSKDTPPSQPDRRTRQLAGAQTVTTKGRQAFTPGIPDDGDPESIWNAIEAMERGRG
jgi:hypothetical protein